MSANSSRARNQIATKPPQRNPYRRVSLRGRRAHIRFSRGARGEKTENDRPPFLFYGESVRTSVHGFTMLLWKRHHRKVIVRISFLTWRHSSGSSPKAGCLCSYVSSTSTAYIRNMKPYSSAKQNSPLPVAILSRARKIFGALDKMAAGNGLGTLYIIYET